MKKLNKKQMQQIKAGAWPGAVLSGIGAILKGGASAVKEMFHGLNEMIGTIGTLALGSKELSKGHVKMNLKVAGSSIDYDDSTKVKADESIQVQRIKSQTVINTASEKHTKLALQPEPKPILVDLGKDHDVVQHHENNADHLVDTSMHFIDDFVHF